MNYLPNRFCKTLPLWAGFALFLPSLAPIGAQAQRLLQAKALSTWKTITDKQTGATILMPPNAKVKPEEKRDDGSGAVVRVFKAEAEGTSDFYILAALRLNKVAIDALRATTPDGANPMDSLIDSATKQFLSRMDDETKKGLQKKVTSKPLAWMGMTGKECTILYMGTKTVKARYGIVRILKGASSFYVLFGGETNRSPETELRIHRFLDSFKVLTPDPAFDEAPATVTPAAPTAPTIPAAPATP